MTDEREDQETRGSRAVLAAIAVLSTWAVCGVPKSVGRRDLQRQSKSELRALSGLWAKKTQALMNS